MERQPKVRLKALTLQGLTEQWSKKESADEIRQPTLFYYRRSIQVNAHCRDTGACLNYLKADT